MLSVLIYDDLWQGTQNTLAKLYTPEQAKKALQAVRALDDLQIQEIPNEPKGIMLWIRVIGPSYAGSHLFKYGGLPTRRKRRGEL